MLKSDPVKQLRTFFPVVPSLNRVPKDHGQLRWPNTVFARAFADAIQRAHKDLKKKHAVNRAIILSSALSVLYFFIIERSVLMALVFYYKDMLEKVAMLRTQQFSAFLLPKEPSSRSSR